MPICSAYNTLFFSFNNLFILLLNCYALLCLPPTGRICLWIESDLAYFILIILVFFFELDLFNCFEVGCCKFWGFGAYKVG